MFIISAQILLFNFYTPMEQNTAFNKAFFVSQNPNLHIFLPLLSNLHHPEVNIGERKTIHVIIKKL